MDDSAALDLLELVLGALGCGSGSRSPSSVGSPSVPNGLVQRDRRPGESVGLVDARDGDARGPRQLLARRVASELGLEPSRRELDLSPPLEDVHRHPDRARVVGDRPLDRLPDPPGRVRRELVAAPPVELLDGAVESDRPLLDQVEERQSEPAVALGDRDDETEVALDHAVLGLEVAALDPLGEEHLLGGGEQPVGGDLREQELEAVLRRPSDSASVDLLGAVPSSGVDHRLSLQTGRVAPSGGA